MSRFLAGLSAAAAAAVMSLWFGGPASAQGPSFDCAKASHEIETLICSDAGLSAKDRKLTEVYAAALEVIKGFADAKQATDELHATQRGWVGGRNDCWKADDKLKCTNDSYDMRIAELQARFMLVQAGAPVFYRCDDNSEIVASFVPTDLPTVRLERGDTTEIAWLTPTGSGSRYDGSFGMFFWIQGDEAQVEWPQGTAFKCKVQK